PRADHVHSVPAQERLGIRGRPFDLSHRCVLEARRERGLLRCWHEFHPVLAEGVAGAAARFIRLPPQFVTAAWPALPDSAGSMIPRGAAEFDASWAERRSGS